MQTATMPDRCCTHLFGRLIFPLFLVLMEQWRLWVSPACYMGPWHYCGAVLFNARPTSSA